MPPAACWPQVMAYLNALFTLFDELIDQYQVGRADTGRAPGCNNFSAQSQSGGALCRALKEWHRLGLFTCSLALANLPATLLPDRFTRLKRPEIATSSLEL